MTQEEKKNDGLHVVVHYAAASMPFKDNEADHNETVGQLKSRVLKVFGLSEGQTPEGNTATYTLYHDKIPLENLNQTLGAVAGDKKVLQLNLSQQLTQGN